VKGFNFMPTERSVPAYYKFRTKTQHITAVQYTNNIQEIINFKPVGMKSLTVFTDEQYITIVKQAQRGSDYDIEHGVLVGDWIVNGRSKSFCIMHDDDFKREYEKNE
jgi:hypothetical protein